MFVCLDRCNGVKVLAKLNHRFKYSNWISELGQHFVKNIPLYLLLLSFSFPAISSPNVPLSLFYTEDGPQSTLRLSLAAAPPWSVEHQLCSSAGVVWFAPSSVQLFITRWLLKSAHLCGPPCPCMPVCVCQVCVLSYRITPCSEFIISSVKCFCLVCIKCVEPSH